MGPADDRFLYGTHYSTPAYVIYWLLRMMPERMLRLHNGHFDAGPRLFSSVSESWESVNESTSSLMELIPEFFVLPAQWLENVLGITTADGPLADVVLPRWAKSVDDFVCKMRAALESDWVSRQLPAWIDLIFGYKQSGEEALKADNLFHPVCYTGSSDGIPRNSDQMPANALETQLQEFGRMPKRLFTEAHPPRLKIPGWELGCLREDSKHSEPWYKMVLLISPSDVEANTPRQRVSTTGTIVAEVEPGKIVATAMTLQTLQPHTVPPLTASGRITGLANCVDNMYSISEDGCLRVSPLTLWSAPQAEDSSTSLRRNFRISPMPLSALAVLRTDLLMIGGHDNAVTLYSSSCGSVLAKCHVHADTVTCLAVSPCCGTLVSGSRDQSVKIWSSTSSSLRHEMTLDDVQQPITCVAAAKSTIFAGAGDGGLMAWDVRSGDTILEREVSSGVAACAVDASERLTAALDEGGELRIWDLRNKCESVRLSVARFGGSLFSAHCFKTDFAGWALIGGASHSGNPTVALWDIPDQREICAWQLEKARGDVDIRFLLQQPGEGTNVAASFLCANALGAFHVFTNNEGSR